MKRLALIIVISLSLFSCREITNREPDTLNIATDSASLSIVRSAVSAFTGRYRMPEAGIEVLPPDSLLRQMNSGSLHCIITALPHSLVPTPGEGFYALPVAVIPDSFLYSLSGEPALHSGSDVLSGVHHSAYSKGKIWVIQDSRPGSPNQQFLTWLLSEAGQRLVQRDGFIPVQKPERELRFRK